MISKGTSQSYDRIMLISIHFTVKNGVWLILWIRQEIFFLNMIKQEAQRQKY